MVRDILFATYPKFAEAGQPQVEVKQQGDTQQIEIAKQHVLTIQKQAHSIQLDNLHVPYTIVFSPMDDALQVGN